MFTIPIILSLIVGFVYMNVYIVGKRTYTKDPVWLEEKEITIDDTGISVVSQSSSKNLKWENIIKYTKYERINSFIYKKFSNTYSKRYAKDDINDIIGIIEKEL